VIRNYISRFVLLAFLLLALPLALAITLKGRVSDPQGNALPGASVKAVPHSGGEPAVITTSGPDGRFELQVATAGNLDITIEAAGFLPVTKSITVRSTANPEVEFRLAELATVNDSVSVTADVNETDVFSPDPAEKVFVRQDLLDANPGRPGAPVSIPGYPIETASSGIKAPQYFAPGVAGDHGEPIAQYISVGTYLLPNNLSANAHGNGYADPNILISAIIESVKVDGGAYDVREGNHSVNLAATYGLRSHLDPFVTLTGDYRDLDLVAGFSPSPASWVVFAASYGNGFLDRLEHRQQYKIIGQRLFQIEEHKLTLFGIGYFGRSYVPGLVPIFALNANDSLFPNYGDTIDPRQKDQTHSAIAAVNDVWQISGSQQLQLSGFFRTYNLSLYSDFGQGLIRQSEFRTVAGGSANYVNKLAEYFSLLGGFDYSREAPRRDDLDHYNLYDPSQSGYYGPFAKVDGNNVTIGSYTPYAAAEGGLGHYFRYYAGWRRDQIDIGNQDLVNPENSFQKWVGVNSPKATVTFLPKESWYAPLLSFSFGQSFFTEDPRVGLGGGGTGVGSPVATAHSFQLVASKTFYKTDLRLTLGHVTSSAELAKIDPDTGLQENEGPSRLRFLTATLRHNFSQGSLLATFSKADARDLDSGLPTPEAPRTLFDLLGTIQKLPFRLQMRGEFEYVGAKPLGTGCLPDVNAECAGVAVKEFRGAAVRPFMDGRLTAGVNFLITSGYTGQTTENFCQQTTPGNCDPSQFQEVVGVRIPSYASMTLTYRFGR
jgi:hypothetical protein